MFGIGYLPNQAANKAMPHVEIGIAIIERGIVRIGQSEVVVEGAFAEGRAQVVLRHSHGVVGSELHASVAEIVSVKRDNQRVVARKALVAARVDVGVLRVEPRSRIRIAKIESSRPLNIQ